MRWDELERMQKSREICRERNLEKALNNPDLLQEVFDNILCEIGINKGQTVSSDVFEFKGGEVILQYAEIGKIDRRKVLKLIADKGEAAKQILMDTAICLMEKYGIIKGGPKLP